MSTDLQSPLLSEASTSPTVQVYTIEDVAKHNTKDDCWVVLQGRVLDCTKWLKIHPGGELAILTYAGQDATEEFEAIHPEGVIDKYASKGLVQVAGVLDSAKDIVSARASAPAEPEHNEESYTPVATFWRPKIEVELLKRLMERRDGRPLFDMLLWLVLLVVFGAGVVRYRDTWLVFPLLFCYGLLYGTACGGREHETGHGTAFKTRWLNRFFYYLTCFFRLMLPVRREAFHATHHRETNAKDVDPEIVQPAPPNARSLILNVFMIESVFRNLHAISCHARGIAAGSSYHGSSEPSAKGNRPPTHSIITARIFLLVLFAVALTAYQLGDAMPLILVGPLPLCYGGWLGSIFSLTQHCGLVFDVPDHRHTTRTIYMNPVFRFM
eukprot:gnl/TRDRNA2_/TRDRNA2_38935_c0_seq2.p1 gnl/TRDRNA2_/TRDRNA2_38935_c0~~gnl/TRDRNA2_/TRDRNA2_38935_c0_seq2.p1  ORF type:complete len:382 (-),score=35.49 gnl/TRDRNA2_/TRDRNA2_38935_c0_seq2:15-1160(-)